MKKPKQSVPKPPEAKTKSNVDTPLWVSALRDKITLWASVGIITLLTFILRWRLLDIPLERDEGGFAYMGYTWINGTPLFSDYVDVKPPLLYILYGVFQFLFGENPYGIHLGLLLFNLGFSITFFLYLKKNFNVFVGFFAAISFVLLSSMPNVFGFAAHATQLLVFPAIGGIWLNHRGLKENKLWLIALGGFLLGLAFLVKQQGLGFMLLGGFYLTFYTLYPKLEWKNWLIKGATLTGAAVLPYILCLIWFSITGNFHHFWYWTYTWPSQFAASQTGNMEIFQMMFNMVTRNVEWLWYLGLAGIVLVWFDQFKIQEKVFTLLLFVTGFLALSIGFHYYPHYFVVLLPAICLGFALSLHSVVNLADRFNFSKTISYSVMSLIALFVLFKAYKPAKDYYFKTDKTTILRNVYGTNPFAEAYVFGNRIEKMSNKGDSILVLGSEPEILFYAKLPSIVEHVHYYQLVDGGTQNDSLQTALIQKAERIMPRFVVFSRIGYSWLNNDPEGKLFKWINPFLGENYQLKGVASIQQGVATQYFWDEEVNKANFENESLLLFERK